MSTGLDYNPDPFWAVVAQRDMARKESAALAQLLEQERAKNPGFQYCEECNTPLSACGEQNPDGTPSMDCLVCKLRSLLAQERGKLDALQASNDRLLKAYQFRVKQTDDLRATVAALQQRCASLEQAGASLTTSIDSIRTMLYGLALDLRQATIAQRAIDEAVDAKRLWNERAALAPDSALQQGGDASSSHHGQTQGQVKGAPTFDPKAAPDSGSAEGGAKP